MSAAVVSHWLTRFDPDDGEPYGSICDCVLDRDHTGAELRELIEADELSAQAREELVRYYDR